MADRKHTPVFDPGECLTQDELLAYQSGQLPASGRHRVEKHLLDCENCAEAFEGLSNESPGTVQEAVNDLTDRAWKRVAEIERRRKRGAWIWITSSAATVLVVIGLFFLNSSEKDKKMEEAFSSAFDENPLPAPGENSPARAAEQSKIAELKSLEKNDGPADLKKSVGKDDANIEIVEDLFSYDAEEVFAMEAPMMETQKNEDPVVYSPGSPEQDFDAGFASPDSTETDLGNNATENYKNMFSSGTVSGTPVPQSNQALNTTKSVSPDVTLSDARSNKRLEEMEVKTNSRDKTSSKASAGVKPEKKTQSAVADFSKEKSNLESETYKDDPVSGDDESISSGPGDSLVVTGYISQPFEQAMKQHKAKNYSTALSQFEALANKNPADMDSRLYAGIDYLALNQPEKAISRFNEVIKGGNPTQQEDAKWYRALAYVKLKEVEIAKKQLKEISDTPGRYRQKATETLKEIE